MMVDDDGNKGGKQKAIRPSLQYTDYIEILEHILRPLSSWVVLDETTKLLV